MKSRMNIGKIEPRIYTAMDAAEEALKTFSIDPKLAELIRIRASQLNGCGFCINMHSKDARAGGETEQRVYAVSAWWETPFFSEAEQVALKLTEEVTRMTRKGVSEKTYNHAVTLFGEQTVAQIIFTIVTINAWNRLAVATHMVAKKD
ncbi:carboxymuconolactone decarboxylase family protein [Chryseolinea lacunae]|uniref:Carboxymuconolactone decarboxylase family protein n=1 Tax=Chryseolinea lacunae TaxID=2801331 RepID=A0ABS1KLL9_9BACT|nr:carboxymuconolactone decarboxylase family protein [Chryseolinea lacunae]MBL0740341.1 carboxymuconolactone decarboxylase family protein [Chryseolinea lacunae]